MIELLLAVLAASAVAGAPPELRRDRSGALIVDSPYFERVTYRIQFNSGTRLAAAERLERLIGPEPYEILEENVDAATATVRLGMMGAFNIKNAASWQHLGVTAMTPEPPQRLPENCSRILVVLPLAEQDEPVATGSPEPWRCPPSEFADGLVIEGLDERGERLWVAAAPDDRAARAVMGPGGEPHGAPVAIDRPVLSALIAVPSVDRLATLRWYEVSDQNLLRRIGETRWRPRP